MLYVFYVFDDEMLCVFDDEMLCVLCVFDAVMR